MKFYEHGKALAVGSAKAAERFPAYEQRALADQLRRAAYSVVLNIAECSGGSIRQQRQQLEVARKSAHEVWVIAELARDLGYMTAEETRALQKIAEETARTLFGYIRTLNETINVMEDRAAS